jgi:hypothetical protein
MWKFISSLFCRGRVPSPNLSSLPRETGRKVVREILASDRGFVAAISKDERGIYRVCCYQWFTEDWRPEAGCTGIRTRFPSLVDTFSAAQEIAEREITEYEATGPG